MVASPCSLHWLLSPFPGWPLHYPSHPHLSGHSCRLPPPGGPHTSTSLPQFPLLSAWNVVPGLLSLLELMCLQNLSDRLLLPPHPSRMLTSFAQLSCQLSPSKVWLSRACIWLQPIWLVLELLCASVSSSIYMPASCGGYEDERKHCEKCLEHGKRTVSRRGCSICLCPPH